MKHFLGIEVAQGSQGLFLRQHKYALEILQECGLLVAKPTEFPIEENHKLALADGRLLKDAAQFCRFVGRLLYLTITCPDLVYVVHILSQFMQAPREEHIEVARDVLWYLKGTTSLGIILKANTNLKLYGFCDSNWGACPLSRRSSIGYFVRLGESPISWKTKKQATVFRSSAEAEYRSIAVATSELVWLRSFFSFLRGLPNVTHEAVL